MGHYLGFEYCVPSESGLQSEAGAVEKRLTHLLDALSQEVTEYVVQRGELTESIRRLRLEIHEKLQRDGWILRARDGGGYVVRHPATEEDRFKLAYAAAIKDTSNEANDVYHEAVKEVSARRLEADRKARGR